MKTASVGWIGSVLKPTINAGYVESKRLRNVDVTSEAFNQGMKMSKQSRNSVKIVGRQWSLVLPAGHGYDREVLLDHLNEAVQRHGNAELVSSNGSFSIARTTEQSTATCATCGEAARPIAGSSGGDLLCMPCILRRMSGTVRHYRPSLAYGRG